jgi:hypothetical protein
MENHILDKQLMKLKEEVDEEVLIIHTEELKLTKLEIIEDVKISHIQY